MWLLLLSDIAIPFGLCTVKLIAEGKNPTSVDTLNTPILASSNSVLLEIFTYSPPLNTVKAGAVPAEYVYVT